MKLWWDNPLSAATEQRDIRHALDFGIRRAVACFAIWCISGSRRTLLRGGGCSTTSVPVASGSRRTCVTWQVAHVGVICATVGPFLFRDRSWLLTAAQCRRAATMADTESHGDCG